MKRFIALIIVAALMGCMGFAFAADTISISVTPLDYHTGQAIAKPAYVVDQVFKLKVGVSIPRFVDKTDLKLNWLINGIKIEEPEKDANGYYIITGIVLSQPASLTVQIKDEAFEHATTAEEMYKALQEDRTVQHTYNFSSVVTYSADDNIFIPKTGGASMFGLAVACMAGGVMIWRKKD